jgi:hypothetical protein
VAHLPSLHNPGEVLCKSFAHYLIELFIFLLTFRSSLYMLDTGPLSQMYWAKILPGLWIAFAFSQSRSFTFQWNPTYQFFCHGWYFWLLLNPKSPTFSPVLPARSLCLWHLSLWYSSS